MKFKNNRGFSVYGIGKTNVLLGKNGCGKSHFLKELEQGIGGLINIGKVRYLSPERGGVLQYSADMDQNMGSNPRWMGEQRRKNQTSNFREQSATLFRRLEIMVLREIENDRNLPGFDSTVEKINLLLDRVIIKRDIERGFNVYEREGDTEISPARLSSGESELISLGIEILAFIKECTDDRKNVLLIDEPDVHLHPDLQERLANFTVEVLRDAPVTLIVATHSTALLAGFSEDAEVQVAFMRRKDTEIEFGPVSAVDRAILPIFGAHPLSNIFNQAPMLLIEGEDDERVWQQAVRSSQGAIRVHPCVVDGAGNFAEFEAETNKIISAVYDEARAYSLRDRDAGAEFIDDVGNVVRMRLNCRAAENLMLTDDALTLAGSNWETLQQRLQEWIGRNGVHQRYTEMQQFMGSQFDRKGHDLKSIRNILAGEISTKPWEVLVGQAIAALVKNPQPRTEGSIREYLGEKVCSQILRLPA